MPKSNSTSFKAIPIEECYAVNAQTGCWEWNRGMNRFGYGLHRVDGKNTTTTAHRWVWEILRGKIDDGLHLDHLCRNRKCVNPEHMEPVTPTENNRRRPDYNRNPKATWETRYKTKKYSSRFRGVSGKDGRWVARLSALVTVGVSPIEEGAEYALRLYRKEVPLAPL